MGVRKTRPAAQDRRHAKGSYALCLLLALLCMALAPPRAGAATTTIRFDPPAFAVGQAVGQVGGVVFPSQPVVFVPKFGAVTASPPQALRNPIACMAADCSNGAHRLEIRFPQGVDQVSVRAGIDIEQPTSFCFPEGTSCPVFGRMIGYDGAGNAVVDSRDVLIGEYDVNVGAVTFPVGVSDQFARIRSVVLFAGKGTFEHDYGNPTRVAIDDLTFSAPEQSPMPPPQAAVPTITFTRPTPGQQLAFPYGAVEGRISAPGGLFAFCTRVNNPVMPDRDRCVQAAAVRPDGSFSILLPLLELQPGVTNAVYAYVWDLVGQSALAAVPFSIKAPPPPVVTIASPTPERQYASGDRVALYGRAIAAGGLAGFCFLAGDAPVPPAASCNRLSLVSDLGFFSDVEVPASQLSPGRNTIRAFVYDRWGQLGTAQVAIRRPVDIRVLAMEISQGIQSAEGIAQNFLQGGLGPAAPPGLPTATGLRQDYRGVRLSIGTTTVVRVFANQGSGGPTPAGSATLTGYLRYRSLGQDKDYPLGLLFPQFSPPQVKNGGPVLTTSERGDPRAAYTFTIPESWWDAMRRYGGNLYLRAKVDPPWTWPATECTGCAANNEMNLSEIHFRSEAPITISPVMIIFTDATGTLRGPASPQTVFAATRTIIPVPENSFDVRPYVASVNVDDLMSLSAEARRDQIFQRVAGIEEGLRLPGYTIGVAPKELVLRGLEAPVVYAWPPRVEGIAITEEARPLNSVAHEFFHQLAYWHAGLGIGSTCQVEAPATSWPPDDRGLIQGFGLDRRQNPDGTFRLIHPGAPGQPSEYFDFMSYCANLNGSDSWISVRNWNSYGAAFPNGLIPDSFWLGSATLTITSSAPPLRFTRGSDQERQAQPGTMRVVASVGSDDTVTILDVGPGDGRRIISAVASPFTLVVLDTAGNVVSRRPLFAPGGHAHGDTAGVFRTMSAEVPAASAARIEIWHDGKLVAQKARSSNVPRVRLLEPRPGHRIRPDGRVAIRWQSTDADLNPLETQIQYSPDGGSTYRVLAAGAFGHGTTLPAALFSSSRNARIRVVANDGFNEATAVVGSLVVDGRPPMARILSPSAAVPLRNDTPVTLVAQARADTGAPLSGSALTWSSGRRILGHGARLSIAPLRAGRQTFQLTALDGQRRRYVAKVTIRVQAVRPTLIGVVVPTRLPTTARSLRIRLGSSIRGTLHVGRFHAPVGIRPQSYAVPIARGSSQLRLVLTVRAQGRSTTLTRVIRRP